MNSLIAIMLLVTCNDDFSLCEMPNEKVDVYPNHAICEDSINKRLKDMTFKGEQIFAQCVATQDYELNKYLTLYWHVNKRGDFKVSLKSKTKNDTPFIVSAENLKKTGA
ncbi:hypothetical protein [Bartonella tamiae]|uniref:Uncharacterized protein n=1 Tax=Bartonella tamiae Th239 TaxID=1094558 RepID=J0ZS99_9HYPH|nr:hypothetical protein [Bartonella tamiae]EJF91628.1 hypothetical protein ME5_00007 [Bartonella tamiae Th239]EJF92697.1 hypothetical protein MEG_01867 [Bartonella tamiae Th307]